MNAPNHDPSAENSNRLWTPDSINVTTFPIGTRSEAPKYGLAIPALLGRAFASQLDGEFTLSINTLDSYISGRERHIPSYLKLLDNVGATPDIVWHDKEKMDGLYSTVEGLVANGHLRPEQRDVESCECGKVERLADAYVHPGAKLYDVADNGNSTCKDCSSECTTQEKSVLVMHFPEDLATPPVVPNLMQREAEELTSRLRGMEYLASRSNRETGVELALDGKSYQLDVDFFWSNHLATLEGDAKVVVGTNHVAWHLVLASALEQCATPDAPKTGLVLAPYMYDHNNFKPDEKLKPFIETQSRRVGLFTLMSMGWSQQNANWDAGKFKFLNKFSEEELAATWHEVMTPSKLPNDSMNVALNGIIRNISTNRIMQLTKQNRTAAANN